MGLLDQLWDDTVAGPRPESGLSRLRKYSSLNSRQLSGKGLEKDAERSYGEGPSDDPVRVTRSIMIVRPAGSPSSGTGSLPPSPAGSTPPLSPFFGARDANRFRRKSLSDVFERVEESGSRIPSSPQDT